METPAQRSRIMARVKGKDTKPEWIVRRLCHALGFRYRLHRKELPGTPDLVFAARRKVIFVHGCFWHAHRCARGARTPKSNQAYWVAKIERNRLRDRRHRRALRDLGWQVLTIWECELKGSNIEARVKRFLRTSPRS